MELKTVGKTLKNGLQCTPARLHALGLCQMLMMEHLAKIVNN